MASCGGRTFGPIAGGDSNSGASGGSGAGAATGTRADAGTGAVASGGGGSAAGSGSTSGDGSGSGSTTGTGISGGESGSGSTSGAISGSESPTPASDAGPDGAAAPCGLPTSQDAGTPILVSCIGEQTTFTTETGPVTECWPTALGALLGAGYMVGNDVVMNANTVLSGNCVTPASKDPVPNIVIIGPFAEHDYMAMTPPATELQFRAAYQNVVNAYLALTPPPSVYVMTPPPAAFVYPLAAEQTFAVDVVRPAVLAVAAATPRVHVVDLFDDAVLGETPYMAGDGHFGAAGQAEVAKLAYRALTCP